MSKTLEFKVFCFEDYKVEKKMSGFEVMEIFKRYGVLDYLGICYNVLHTTGREYIIDDIDIFIEARKDNPIYI